MSENKTRQYDWTNIAMLMSALATLLPGVVLVAFESFDESVMVMTLIISNWFFGRKGE